MGKLEEMMNSVGGNIGESMGASRLSGTVPSTAPKMPYGGMPPRLQGIAKNKDAADIPVEKVVPDHDQPREEFDEGALARLAESLKSRGQLQPIRVRWDEGRAAYMILVGERRWRAARMAGLSTVSAIIVEGHMEPGELLAVQLIENCLREDLGPVEQAKAFRALMDRNGWSTRQVADELAITQSNVVRALAILDLPESVRDQVDRGKLSPTTAYEISKVGDPLAQEELGRRVVQEKLTGAEIKEIREGRQARPRRRKIEHKDPNGCTVLVSVPDGLDDDDAFAAIRRALKSFKKSRSSRSEAA